MWCSTATLCIAATIRPNSCHAPSCLTCQPATRSAQYLSTRHILPSANTGTTLCTTLGQLFEQTTIICLLNTRNITSQLFLQATSAPSPPGVSTAAAAAGRGLCSQACRSISRLLHPARRNIDTLLVCRLPVQVRSAPQQLRKRTLECHPIARSSCCC